MNHAFFRSAPIAAALVLALGLPPAMAQSIGGSGALRLSAPSTGDQVVAAVQAPAGAALETGDLDRTPVAVSWALEPDQAIDTQPAAFVQESRGYWRDVDAQELRAGIALPLSATGAVIRFSPHASNAGARLSREDLVVIDRGNHLQADIVQAAADVDALRSAGMDAPAGTLAVKLSDTYVAPSITLAVPNAAGRWLVHVHEPNSTIALRLGTARDVVVAGQPLKVQAACEGARASAASGLISAPDGHSQPLTFTRQRDGSFAATIAPDAAHAGARALWEVHTFAQCAGPDVPRDARTAFAVALPVARLDGSVERLPGAKADGITLRFGVEAATASRYQVAGVLFGTARDGKQYPVAIGQSAAWLEAGNGTLDLRFDAASLANVRGIGAPWELRDLRLVNQADLGLLERRSIALSF